MLDLKKKKKHPYNSPWSLCITLPCDCQTATRKLRVRRKHIFISKYNNRSVKNQNLRVRREKGTWQKWIKRLEEKITTKKREKKKTETGWLKISMNVKLQKASITVQKCSIYLIIYLNIVDVNLFIYLCSRILI